jgi:tetratricopeptide (TPR) repeat protein
VPYLFAVAMNRSGADLEGPAGAEVVAALRASIAARPEFAPSRSELGRVLLRRGDTDGAIRELEKAAALDPSRTATLYNLAQAYRKKGERERAAELLARVSKLNDAERGDADAEMKRVVLRLVREGAAR